MGDKIKLVIFQLALHKFALPISAVERIIQIVEISELPKSPEFLMGIINVHGEIVPVIDPRVLFDLPLKEIELSDQLIFVKTANVKIALWVDVTNEVLDIPLEKYIDIKKEVENINDFRKKRLEEDKVNLENEFAQSINN